jgi:hypothetical protein
LLISLKHPIWQWVSLLSDPSFKAAKVHGEKEIVPMIWIAFVVSVLALAGFIVVVTSIRLCERRQSLFDRSRGGLADALTRRLLDLHTELPEARARTENRTGTPSLTRR